MTSLPPSQRSRWQQWRADRKADAPRRAEKWQARFNSPAITALGEVAGGFQSSSPAPRSQQHQAAVSSPQYAHVQQREPEPSYQRTHFEPQVQESPTRQYQARTESAYAYTTRTQHDQPSSSGLRFGPSHESHESQSQPSSWSPNVGERIRDYGAGMTVGDRIRARGGHY